MYSDKDFQTFRFRYKTEGLFVKKGGLDYTGMKDLVSR